MSTITKKCSRCGADMDAAEVTSEDPWVQRILDATAADSVCDACCRAERAKRAEEARAQQAQEVVRAIRQATPARFLATDRRDPRWNSNLAAKVDRWRPTAEKPWLGLVGVPGACKTRCAFEVLSRVAASRVRLVPDPWGLDRSEEVESPTWEITTGGEFKRAVMDQFGDGGSRGSTKKLKALRECDVLLFDELGEKIKPTPSVMEAMFELIDHRHARNLITIWTSNSTPEFFCASWPEEFAGPVAGRILESSTIITA